MVIKDKLKSYIKGNETNGLAIIDANLEDYPDLMDITISLRMPKFAFLKTLEGQLDKGMKKYGETIDECPNTAYDWNEMIWEELIDILVYNEKKIQYEKEIAETSK